jgi:prepilin-type N-terminal cleavage/methylation domain-containing protein
MIHHPTNPRAAFTLVELAIVIVIIGLIAGGVLVGTSLIKAAEIRNVSSLVTQISNASATFRTKYANIPGDIQATRATQFNFVARSGATGHGDGNHALESCVSGGQNFGCETALFWQDLSDALLIKERFVTTADAYIDGTVAGFAINNHLPPIKIREGVNVFAYQFMGRNSLFIGAMAVDATGNVSTTDGLSVLDAENIDRKLDNAVPTSGMVRAMTTLITPDAGAAASPTECVINTTTPPTYNASGAFGSQINCQLVFINTL